MNKKRSTLQFSNMFPSKWLSAADVESGTEATVIGLSEEVVGRDMETKYAVQFREFNKRLLLNLTNGRALRDIAGSEDVDEWTGTVVRLTTPMIEFGGKTQPAIRIEWPLRKEPVLKQRAQRAVQQPQVEDDSEDEGPF
jgi:hypothetical protein